MSSFRLLNGNQKLLMTIYIISRTPNSNEVYTSPHGLPRWAASRRGSPGWTSTTFRRILLQHIIQWSRDLCMRLPRMMGGTSLPEETTLQCYNGPTFNLRIRQKAVHWWYDISKMDPEATRPLNHPEFGKLIHRLKFVVAEQAPALMDYRNVNTKWNDAWAGLSEGRKDETGRHNADHKAAQKVPCKETDGEDVVKDSVEDSAVDLEFIAEFSSHACFLFGNPILVNRDKEVWKRLDYA